MHINNWHLNEHLLAIYKERVTRAYNWLSADVRENAYVLFTVHSQPIDPERNGYYAEQFNELASTIAKATNITN